MVKLQTRYGRLSEFTFSSTSIGDVMNRIEASPRHKRRPSDSAVLRESGKLIGWSWSIRRVLFHFERVSLSVGIDYGRVDWTIADSAKFQNGDEYQRPPEFERQLGSVTTVWKPGAILDSCVGRRCVEVIPGHVWLRVAFDGMRPLWFWNLENDVDATPVLYFFEDLDSEVMHFEDRPWWQDEPKGL